MYPDKQSIFDEKISLGKLIEIPRVRQYFNNDFNFVFRSDFRPEQYRVYEGETFDHTLTFKQRLRLATASEPLAVTNLANIPTMSVTRNCLKVGDELILDCGRY